MIRAICDPRRLDEKSWEIVDACFAALHDRHQRPGQQKLAVWAAIVVIVFPPLFRYA